MDDDKTVTATFTRITYDLTMAVDPVGAGTTDPAVGVHTYPAGAVVDITATPAAGYAFDHWSGACTDSGACQVTMDADKAVTAHFAEITYDLTMAVDPIGAGTTDPAVGVHTYPEGTVVDITATPAPGYSFDHWSGDCTGMGTCQVTMDGDRNVTAHFTGITYELTMAVDPIGAGTTDPSVGVHAYAEGAVVDITATPATGYAFDYWSGDCTGTDPCQVTMDEDRAVTAHFTEVTYELTIAVDPVGGGTTDPAVGDHTYPAGTVVDIAATPATGYAFDYWSGDCTGTDPCQVTMDEDRAVTAHFTEVTYELTMAVDPVGAGTTDPAVGDHTYPAGTVVDITATPATGYAFHYWMGDVADINLPSTTITMDEDKTVTAYFVDIAPPDTTITAHPDDPSFSAEATFSFTSTEPGSTFECQLDGGGFTPCTSPHTYAGLDYGDHTFEVRAIDEADNVDPTPASFSWTIGRRIFLPLIARSTSG
jgi:uncharacterized repeat protein (TIGR02543 family)